MSEIGVDIGGTFTDVVLRRAHHPLVHAKVPSTPQDPILGVRRGVEKVLALSGVGVSEVTRFIHGSTVAINALLERKGATTGIITTRGFEDTLEIGRQKRSRMYELFLEPETPIFLAPRRRRLGVGERIAADGAVIEPLRENEVRAAIRELVRGHGVTAVAVCYLFSFRNPAHELKTRAIIAEEFPGLHVSLSSAVDPTFREYERLVVTTLDAYLHGAVGDYVTRLEAALSDMGITATLQVMQSRGGITGAAAVTARPVSLLLSGLAAGVIGSKFVAEGAGCADAITLDMGGTSCDIALVRAGKPIVASESRVGGFPLRTQMIDVNTIGAGGGSIAWLDDVGGLRVGPQSAGAAPGPACYGQGGQEATVTDASVVLGYLNPANFAAGTMALDPDAARAAIDRVARRLGLGTLETAAGIHSIVNARMADEVRRVSIRRGHDPREFVLLPLGGAGPVHGGAIALELGIPRLLVPEVPGVLSAFGLLVAAVEHDHAETFAVAAEAVDRAKIRGIFDRLAGLGREKMERDGVPLAAVERFDSAEMRYLGQSYELAVALPQDADDPVAAAVAGFHAEHQRHYGHADPAAAVEFVNLRTVLVHRLPALAMRTAVGAARHADPTGHRRAYFALLGKSVETPVYARAGLAAGQRIAGPAIIEQADSTLVVYPGQRAAVDKSGNILLEREDR